MNVFMDADPVWEEKYSRGHTQRYPWDCIVSFVYRNAPRGAAPRRGRRPGTGCGTGGNLWFLAREGFRASGIDASPSAVAAARTRLSADGLDAALHVGSFCELPFPDASFDLVLDRCSVTCVGAAGARQAVLETRRVLRPGGLFFFNPYSAAHDSRRTGRPGRTA
jgi:SAM-dependent methyltransferase